MPKNNPPKPLIQIGDEIREMTDEEYAEWQMTTVPYEE